MTEAIPKKSDLKVRVLSAIVMVVVAGTALWLDYPWWHYFTILVGMICFAEFARLIFRATSSFFFRIFSSFFGLIYIYIAVTGLHVWVIHDPGYMSLVITITPIGIVVCTDVGAYFAGRLIGGPKIAPKISPSKTWAGLCGGMLAAALWSMIALKLYLIASESDVLRDGFELARVWGRAALVGAILAVVAQAGDFFESWLKRKAGVKDSSNLIPGHGGVFDRVDGLLAVMLVTTLFDIRPF